jgi:O-antigen/teichoic acid export membrane protein
MMRRIISGMGANSLSMLTTIGIQLASLPLFLHYWDTDTYGTWLMLSAIPAYISMADIGMVAAAGNKMTIAMGRDDPHEANRVFQSAQLFMLAVCASLAVILVASVAFLPIPGLEDVDRKIALSALLLGVLVGLFCGLAEAAFKATNRYAIGTLLGNFVRLAEWIGLIIGLVTFGTFAAMALVSLAFRTIGTVLLILLSRNANEGLHWGTSHADRAETREMLKPAFSFMVFPVANAFSFQGVTLIAGAVLGPTAVAIFNTYRTVARLCVQVTAIFSYALWPEFSRLFGKGGPATVAPAYRRTLVLGAAISITLATIVYFISPFLLEIWTKGKIEFLPDLMSLMLLYAAVGSICHVPRVVLMATNQHMELSKWCLIGSALTVLLVWFGGTHWDLQGIGAASVLAELFIAVITLRLAYSKILSSSGSHALT